MAPEITGRYSNVSLEFAERADHRAMLTPKRDNRTSYARLLSLTEFGVRKFIATENPVKNTTSTRTFDPSEK